HPKAHVADGASKPLVRHHASDVQVLDYYRLVFAAQPGRELVGEVRSDIGNAGMQPCQCLSGLLAVAGDGKTGAFRQRALGVESRSDLCRLDLAAEAARVDAKAAQGRLERFRRSKQFAIGERRGGLDAEIDANDPVCLSAAVELLVL